MSCSIYSWKAFWYLVEFQRVILGCWVVDVLRFPKTFLQVNLLVHFLKYFDELGRMQIWCFLLLDWCPCGSHELLWQSSYDSFSVLQFVLDQMNFIKHVLWHTVELFISTMISRASEFISIFVKIYYLVSVCLEDMDVSCVLLTQNSNLSKSTYPYVTNGKRNISPDLCKFNGCNQERKINSHVKYFREHFVPVRPSLSVSVRLNICCSVFIYLKTN